MMKFSLLSVLALVSVWYESSFAQTILNRNASVKDLGAMVYHGKLVRPNGSVPTGSLPVVVKVLSPDPSLCVLWAESQTVDFQNGAFSIELGHATHRLSGPAGGAASSFRQAFINNPSMTIPSANCEQGTTYTPGTSDDRLLTASFSDNGNVVEVSGLPIKSVPFALQAEEIGGYGLSNLVKISGSGSSTLLSPLEVDDLKVMATTHKPTGIADAHKIFGANAAGLAGEYKTLVGTGNVSITPGAGTITIHGSSGATGTVTQVSGTPPLSVVNGMSTPQIAIAQANATTSGYLSSSDWNTFSGKLGTALAENTVFVGNGSNVALGTFFGIGQLRNNVGTAQFPGACGASQTLTWSAVTDVMSCTGISIGSSAVNMSGANRLLGRSTTGAGAVEELTIGSGLQLTGTTLSAPSTADNLGNHVATANLNLSTHILVGNGGSAGIAINASGNVGVGTTSPGARMSVREDSQDQVIRMDRAAAGSWSYLASYTNNVRRGTVGTDPSNNMSILSDTNLTMYANGTERMRVTTAGNVGIGTTSPAHRLEVNGNIAAADIYSIAAGGWLSSLLAGKVNKSGDTVTGAVLFQSNKGAGTTVGSQSSYQIQAFSNDGGAAGMSFHRGGAFAVNFGLDPDNVMRIGGWSAGANRWQLDMNGNETLAGALTAAGAVYTGDWFRVNGNGGIHWQNYGGGFQMYDVTYLRVYGNKVFHSDNTIQSATSVNAPAFNYNSDRRLKKDIVTLDNSLEKTLSLRGVSFGWRKNSERDIGFIAQEVEEVLPDLVKTSKDEKHEEFKTVRYGNIVAVVVEALKEFYREFKSSEDAKNREIEELRVRVRNLEQRLDALGAQAHGRD